MTTEQKLKDAVVYAVNRIADDPAVYWHFLGTESWGKLVDAFAAATGKDPDKVMQDWSPDPDKYKRQCETEERRAELDDGYAPICPVCEARDEYERHIPEESFVEAALSFPVVLDAWETLADYDRREILSRLVA